MKQTPLLLALVALSAIAVGCDRSERAATESREATTKQLDKVRTETKEAAQDMKDYTYAQKSEFVDRMNSQMAALTRDLDELAARIEKASDSVKAEAQPKLQGLREETARLNKQLDEAKNSTESAWESVKGGFKKAYQTSADGVRQARQWVSDKIAP